MSKPKNNRSKYISQGQHNNVSSSITKLIRNDYKASIDRVMNQQTARLAGKRIVEVIKNPNKTETNMSFIRKITLPPSGGKRAY